jgi:hypothetical protein
MCKSKQTNKQLCTIRNDILIVKKQKMQYLFPEKTNYQFKQRLVYPMISCRSNSSCRHDISVLCTYSNTVGMFWRPNQMKCLSMYLVISSLTTLWKEAERISRSLANMKRSANEIKRFQIKVLFMLLRLLNMTNSPEH